MSDREFSDPMKYEISIDWDDAADGSDGGYDKHGNLVIPSAMQEIIRLRAEKARETLRLREFVSAAIFWQDRSEELIEALELALASHNVFLTGNPPQDAWLSRGVEPKARAAIEKAKGEQG